MVKRTYDQLIELKESADETKATIETMNEKIGDTMARMDDIIESVNTLEELVRRGYPATGGETGQAGPESQGLTFVQFITDSVKSKPIRSALVKHCMKSSYFSSSDRTQLVLTFLYPQYQLKAGASSETCSGPSPGAFRSLCWVLPVLPPPAFARL